MGEDVLEYMILGLCVLAFCVIFSGAVKAAFKVGARGTLGLLAVYLCNFILKGAGFGSLYVGVNLFNGLLIGILGLPGLVGLYAFRFFTM